MWLLITVLVFAAFSEGMVDDGYMDVFNVDISSVVIDAMKKKYSNRPQLKCIFCLFLCRKDLWLLDVVSFMFISIT